MNAPLNTSVALVVIVALWLIWVVPYFLRLRTVKSSTVAVVEMDESIPERESTTMLMDAATPRPQEAVMTDKTGPAKVAEKVQESLPFAIKYDRTAIALLGVVAALAVLIGGVLRIAGVATIWIPVVGILVVAGCFAALRSLAIRDRKQRVEAAFQAAMSSTAAPAKKPQTSSVATSAKPAVVFDAQQSKAPEKPAPLTATELRRAALAVAEGAKVNSDGTWEPVAVPKPSYVEAAKVERPAPAPLDLPEQPKAAARTSIKKSEAGINKPVAPAAKTSAALNNLDDVLQRRRA